MSHENLDFIALAQLISDTEHKIKEAKKNKSLVEQERLTLAREILTLQIRKKDLEIALSKSGQIVSELELDIKELTREYWDKKNG